MSKVKMRCTVCGKWFQSANVKEVTCPDCVQKAKKDKLATKNLSATQKKVIEAGSSTATSAPRVVAPPPKPKPQLQSGTNQWLDKLEDVKIGQPEEPPIRHKASPPPVQRDQRPGQGSMRPNGERTYPPQQNGEQGGPGRAPGGYRSGGGYGARPRPTAEGISARGPRGEQKPGRAGAPPGGPRGKGKPRLLKPTAPPKPPREKIPPPPPFVPTLEQIQQVQARYLELAQPAEFDGIRTQIAHELGIPKKAVKKIVKDFRQDSQIPSWWELQVYRGSREELDKIKELYMPYLPLAPIGVHKLIATQLAIKPSTTYQAIKLIRQELDLPQYNDPLLHEGFVYTKRKEPAPVNEPLANEPAAEKEPVTVNEPVTNEPVTETAQSEQ